MQWLKVYVLAACLFVLFLLSSTPCEAAVVKIKLKHCAAMRNTNEQECKKKIRRCWGQHKVSMKWGGKGCVNPKTKKLMNDGGCMCAGSCTYQCEQRCNADKECYWNANGKCENKITGKVGPKAICDGQKCRKTGFFCDVPVPGAYSGDQSNCCEGHCQQVDGLYSCCRSNVGADCEAQFDCCQPNICSPNGKCVAPYYPPTT